MANYAIIFVLKGLKGSSNICTEQIMAHPVI